MSQYGSPPDPDQPEGPDSGQTGASEPDPAAPGAPGYNPYPDNWNAAPPPPPPNPYEQANPYGQQPPDPYGQQQPANPYGQQPTNPYGQPSPYASSGQPGSPANPYAGPANSKPTFGFGGYAGWFTRVGAYLIDYIAGLLAAIPALLGYVVLLTNTSTKINPDGSKSTTYSGSVAVPTILILIGAVTGIAFFVWNICIRQGRTGATIGKSVLAIRLVNSDLQPIGAGWAFLRYLLHILDGICYLGYLWPIWDDRKQTFADKIMNTFVIQATTSEPRPY